jgi:NADPH2:quinone reductase
MWYLTQIAEAGALRPVLDEQLFSLKDVSQAQDRLSSGQGMGKVVIDVIRNSND